MNVLLIGMKHCGKTTVGRALAERTNRRFADVDDLIRQTHERETGEDLTVREIFRRNGEAFFEEIEARAVRRFFLMVWNNRRRYGGYVVHFGVLIVVLGITWSTVFAVTDTVQVSPGSQTEIPGDYSVEFAGFTNESKGNHYAVGPDLNVYDSGGQYVYQATPRLDTYPRRGDTLRDPDIWGTTARDLYFIFNGARDGVIHLEVKYMPFVALIWWGSGIVVAGGLLALWPEIGGDKKDFDAGPNTGRPPDNDQEGDR